MTNVAMFAGLVFDEQGQPIEVAWVGADACYVIDDGDFRRHVDAELVDRQVLRFFKQQVEAQRDQAVRSILQLMGSDDIFSKTAVEYSINRMEDSVGQPMPPEARSFLQSMGFRIIVDYHGEVVDVELPGDTGDDF